jgi:cellulose biosynthesis protein BcsQ
VKKTARILAVGSMEQGEGVALLVTQLGMALERRGRAVLVVDLDARACVTRAMAGAQAAGGDALHAALELGAPPVVAGTRFGVDLVAGGPRPSGDRAPGAKRAARARAGVCALLGHVRAEYDWVLVVGPVDDPGELGEVLACAGRVLVPTLGSSSSLAAARRLVASCQRVRARANPALTIGLVGLEGDWPRSARDEEALWADADAIARGLDNGIHEPVAGRGAHGTRRGGTR